MGEATELDIYEARARKVGYDSLLIASRNLVGLFEIHDTETVTYMHDALARRFCSIERSCVLVRSAPDMRQHGNVIDS